MKRIILIVISLVMALSGCCIYDYGCATVDMIDMIAEGTGESYIEALTGEEYNENNIVNEKDSKEEVENGTV